jgi:hypothetical protein
MAATFPGGDLPDAGFLGTIDTPGLAARPPDKFTQSHRNESQQFAAGATIELPQRHGFGHVLGTHRHGSSEIRDRARDTQHAVIGACRQREALHRRPEQAHCRSIGANEFEHGGAFESRVRAGLPLKLQFPRSGHPRCDDCGRLTAIRAGNLGRGDARHLDVQVDPIQQRPRDPRSIGRDSIRRAPAPRRRVAEVPAGTRIHCRHQLKARWKFRLPRRT